MDAINFLVLVVIYKLSPAQSATLSSLARCGASKAHIRLVIRDNSPAAYTAAERDRLDQMLDGIPYVYRHNGKNEYLSAIYNQTIKELRPCEHLVLLDHDSVFDNGFFTEAARCIKSHPGISLFLPRVYSGQQLVSPSRMVLFKGSYLRHCPPGLLPTRRAMAINSGMVISGSYLLHDFPGYDTDYHFYVTDCDFMWKFRRHAPYCCVMDYSIHHKLDFYGNDEPFGKKVRRFREMRRAFLTAMRKRGRLAYWLCFMYMDAYSVKFAAQHRDRRFLFVR